MISELSVEYKLRTGKGEIDLVNDDLKCILMQTSYAWDPVNHKTYSDVSASELPDGNGYTAGGQSLTGKVWQRDDANKRAVLTCDDVIWLASGGSIGPCKSIIVYDNTVTDKPIIGYGEVDDAKTAVDGTHFYVRDIVIRHR